MIGILFWGIEMDKVETLQIKGTAIVLMFWHHLFGCGNFLMLPENPWLPCLGRYDAMLGTGSKLCIALFTVVSGYGLYKSYIYIEPIQKDISKEG